MFGLPKKDSKNSEGGERAIPAATFIHELLQQNGAKQDFDGVALHPYSHGLDFVKKQATVMRNELRKSHDSAASLWITETGAASGGPKNSLNLGSKKAQAKRVTDTYKLFSEHRKDWKVKLVAWYSWEDVPGYQGQCFFCERTGWSTATATRSRRLTPTGAPPSRKRSSGRRSALGESHVSAPCWLVSVGQGEKQVDDPEADQDRDKDADEEL